MATKLSSCALADSYKTPGEIKKMQFLWIFHNPPRTLHAVPQNLRLKENEIHVKGNLLVLNNENFDFHLFI